SFPDFSMSLRATPLEICFVVAATYRFFCWSSALRFCCLAVPVNGHGPTSGMSMVSIDWANRPVATNAAVRPVTALSTFPAGVFMRGLTDEWGYPSADPERE